MKKIIGFLGAVGFLTGFFFLLPTPAEEDANGSRPLAFTGVRIFDGENVLASGTVVVVDGTITAAGEDVAVPDGAEVVDGRGKTLLPGLIDAHTHVWGDALERALQFGVTTELDMFSDHGSAAVARREQAAGEAFHRADLFSAGTMVTAPGGHGTQFGLEIPTLERAVDAEAFVAARLAEGSDYIKLVYDDGKTFEHDFPSLDRETVVAVVRAAREHDTLAVAHIHTLEAGRQVLEAGADGLVHLFIDQLDPEFGRLAAESGAFVIPTLSILESMSGLATGAPLAEDERLEPYLLAGEQSRLQQTLLQRDDGGERYQVPKTTVGQLREAGVPILAGTDAPNPGTVHGASLHRELELLVEAGLTPREALAAATSVPADAFRLNDRGRIAPGRRADLVLVEGDPTADITATRAIAGIWKQGRRVERRSAADAAAPSRVAAGRVSDFESGELDVDFGLGWVPSTDSRMGGTSTVELDVISGGAENSARALRIHGEGGAGVAYPWAGALFFPGQQPMAPVDLSDGSEVVFWARGDGRQYRVMMFAESLGQIPASVGFVAGEAWERHAVTFAEFGVDGSDVKGILFSSGLEPGSFAFEIDNVEIR